MTVHNLPVSLTSFVGRGQELGEIEALVSGRRLVTLAGVGGCGKTRLAVELATRVKDRWPDGVWLVDLGPVTDPDQVPRLTAATLKVLLEPGSAPIDALAAQLRQKRLLLCLDTCEHLLDPAAALTDTVLRTCPEVSIMATSREPLGVAGETVWRVPSLKEDEAVELFVDRASLAAPGFDVHTTQTDVRAVCEQVDNIPLAVELAAAWVRALSPAQIAAGLADRFRVLAGGARRAIPRHQTLQASMEWSHALLDDDEKAVFRRMAVFSGTFTLEAAEAVCDSELAMIGRLVDKSLVSVRENDGHVRYRLLDTVRQYAQERLDASGETETIRDRHLDHYLREVEAAQDGLETDQDTWRRELLSQQDNINAALDRGLSTKDDRGRRLAAAMARQWFITGQVHAGLDFLRRAADPADRSSLQSRLLAGIALLGMLSGRMVFIDEVARQGLELAAENGDDVARGRCLTAMAFTAFFSDFEKCEAVAREAHEVRSGDPFTEDFAAIMAAYSFTARNRHEEAIAIARPVYERSAARGDRFCAAFAYCIELWAGLETGDLRRATEVGEGLLPIVGPLGDYFAVGTMTANIALVAGMTGNIAAGLKMLEGIVRSIDETPDVDAVAFEHSMGMLHLWDGDLDDAVRWLERGISRMTTDTRHWTATRCFPGLAAGLRLLGRLEEAAEVAAKGVRLAEEHKSPYILADALDEQAFLIRDTDPGRARDLHHQALSLRREVRVHTYTVRSLDALAHLEAAVGNHAEAVRLLGTASSAREAMGHPLPPVDLKEHEAVVAALRGHLGDDEFLSLWDDGAARSLDDAVAALTRGRGPRNRPQAGWASLTPTELDVVRLVAEGLSNPEIATRLYMSRGTVKAHLTHIYAKLAVTNRTELAILAAANPA
ncbi:LuxR C-terminal-related transcriptional regulator [Actinocrispum sp. NPDC049592]|uniref:LuxR C-terminal-related transcriptional regulator n=1 Tax=Actinocrispum sp. NPDC049592 TaxID=3154835 RepID=UPI00344289F7